MWLLICQEENYLIAQHIPILSIYFKHHFSIKTPKSKNKNILHRSKKRKTNQN